MYIPIVFLPSSSLQDYLISFALESSCLAKSSGSFITFLVGINHSHEPQTDPTRLKEKGGNKYGEIKNKKTKKQFYSR